eukprot:CAMPEP_0117750884 /NCGR_PEP_ID=MMETSP0947-20121206/10643_1 /TAXON_ID=44440 /ORGANISM="Chattonella subsalsa, Strain CCMP2191" /LENGTH=474 /DNA_ID=CAMNT_0005569155 /DNA_START=132 /DNA_END=1556 /DNA_ORIENTATION=+
MQEEECTEFQDYNVMDDVNSLVHRLSSKFTSSEVMVIDSFNEQILSNIRVEVRGNILLHAVPNSNFLVDLNLYHVSTSMEGREEIVFTRNLRVHKKKSIGSMVSEFKLLFPSAAEAERCRKVLSSMHHHSCNIDDLKPLVTIGKGKFGTVMICESPRGAVAVKESHLGNTNLQKHAIDERVLLDRLDRNPFILQTFAFVRRGSHIYNVMELCPGGDLYTLISNNFQSVVDRANFYAAEVLIALQHLHYHGIIYRDLKPENVMVCSDGHLKLGDLGLSKYLGKEVTMTLCGTESYMSPEVLNGREEGYSFSVDFWQFACFVYELHVGHSPFYQSSGSKAVRRKAVREAKYVQHSSIPSTARDLIDQVLRVNIPERIYKEPADWNAMKEDVFFEGTDWGAIKTRTATPPIIPQTSGKQVLQNFDASFRRISARLTNSSGTASANLQKKFFGFDFYNFSKSYGSADEQPCKDSAPSS